MAKKTECGKPRDTSHPRTMVASSSTRAVKFPGSMDDILVLNFMEEDKCYDYVGMDENGNKIYKQVTCPWDTIVYTDD